MIIGNRTFDTNQGVYIMGILNVTPDSFSDGGRYNRLDQALYHAEALMRGGADILDSGGESTRPGHTKITAAEEIERVCPVIEAIKKRLDLPLSLDTYKADVAEAGLTAGADMINDIWGLKWNDKMAGLIAHRQASVCIMHNRTEAKYDHFMDDVITDLKDSLRLAEQAGIDPQRICIDAGIGFAKSPEQNLLMLNHMEALQALGYPMVLGASRKSVIGMALDLPTDQREEGTLVTTVFGILKGCSIIRVHNVKQNVRAAKMTLAILREHAV